MDTLIAGFSPGWIKPRADNAPVPTLGVSTGTYDIVHMGAREFDAAELQADGQYRSRMERIADDWFRDHPDTDHVLVFEHGGWFLGYHREGLRIYATANDAAVWGKDRPPLPRQFSGRIERRP